MKKSTLVIILVILLVIVGFTFYSSISSDNRNTARDEAISEDESRPTVTIPTKHQYKNGEHIFVGQINLPSPCHSFNAEMLDGDIAEIKITVNDPEEGTFCAQVITPRTFKVTLIAPEDKKFKITLNDEEATLNLFEVSPDKDIDTVELFMKG